LKLKNNRTIVLTSNFIISNFYPDSNRDLTSTFQMSRDHKLQEQWDEIVTELSAKFSEGETLDLDAIIYLIGVQELGKGPQKFGKDDKINLMHIAICRLLEPYGYYEFDFRDADGWPHYKVLKELPALRPGEQTVLMKEAIVWYFSLRNVV
jgi:hypothetical protein